MRPKFVFARLLLATALPLGVGCAGDEPAADTDSGADVQTADGGTDIGTFADTASDVADRDGASGPDADPLEDAADVAADTALDADLGGYCSPCSTDIDCDGRCVEIADGRWCLPYCDDGACVDGGRCDPVDLPGGVIDLCVPETMECDPCENGAPRNPCGGCGTLPGEPMERCGSCESGEWVCDGPNALYCAGDDGASVENACGGCGALAGVPDQPCGPCGDGVFACSDRETLTCRNATPDEDGDGRCGTDDICPGYDDGADADEDGTPDGCDPCPEDATDDSDSDGVCDGVDVCAGHPDDADADGDGTPDGCDVCSAGDDAMDSDEDGTPDACDCDDAGCATVATCAESTAGAACTCPAGYEGSGTTCLDVDECARDIDACPLIATCANTAGSYTCECPTGYRDGDRTCVDIDECADETDDCSPNASCTNTAGSFECACNPGFAGDGRRCLAVTEWTFDFPTDEDAFVTAGPGELLVGAGDGYAGTRELPLAQISAVEAVDIVLDANNIYSSGGIETGCFGFATIQVLINGSHFATVILNTTDTPGLFQIDPPPAPVVGPVYDIEFNTFSVACGSFDVSETESTITVLP